MKLGLSGILTRDFHQLAADAAPAVRRARRRARSPCSRCRARRSRRSACRWSTSWSPANGYKADEAVELVTRPLEDIVKGINGVEHVYSQTEDDRVVVTARFLVGTDEDTAVLRVHEKIRANIRRHAQGHSRAADRRPRHQRRRDRRADAVAPSPTKPSEWTDNGLYQVAEELQHELTKVDGVGVDLYRRREPQPDPRRARSRAPLALRHHARAADRQARERQPLLPGRRLSRATAKPFPVVAGQTLQGVPDIGLLLLTSRDGRPGLCQGRRQCRRRRGRARASRLDDDARQRAASSNAARRSASPSPSARAPMPSVVAEDVMQRLETIKGRIVPAGLDVAVTRNYGETANEKANELLFHLALATVSIVVLITADDRLARGRRRADHHPDHDPADALRLLDDGLHDQPRQPVRAHLLDRHPRRRRDRRGREHRPPLVACAARAASSRRRSKRSPKSAIRPSSRRLPSSPRCCR